MCACQTFSLGEFSDSIATCCLFKSTVLINFANTLNKETTYLITLDGSRPQLAAITTFGSAWSILDASSFAAKPGTHIYKYNRIGLAIELLIV